MVRITINFDSKLWRAFYSALLSLAGVLIAILAIGSIYAAVRPSNSGPLFRLGAAAKVQRTAGTAETQDDSIRVFSGLGRLRIPLVNSSTLILSIAFPYSAADSAFNEELAGKISEFKVIANGYFSSLPADKVIVIDEDAAKPEILRRYNEKLRLGRIDALYLSNMMIIDGNL
jgi:flagellar basal body-associated protein FliL